MTISTSVISDTQRGPGQLSTPDHLSVLSPAASPAIFPILAPVPESLVPCDGPRLDGRPTASDFAHGDGGGGAHARPKVIHGAPAPRPGVIPALQWARLVKADLGLVVFSNARTKTVPPVAGLGDGLPANKPSWTRWAKCWGSAKAPGYFPPCVFFFSIPRCPRRRCRTVEAVGGGLGAAAITSACPLLATKGAFESNRSFYASDRPAIRALPLDGGLSGICVPHRPATAGPRSNRRRPKTPRGAPLNEAATAGLLRALAARNLFLGLGPPFAPPACALT